MTQKSEAQKGNITPEMEYVAEYENIDVNKLARLIDKGLVVIPKNINGHSKPCGIGEGLKTKINANIGSSSKIDDIDLEINKAKLAQEYGADALMDLSTGSDLKLFRKKIMEAVDICIGTVPIYEAGVVTLSKNREIIDMDPDDIFKAIENQAKEGVDFMTLHCGITKDLVQKLKDANRMMGIVSRGGTFMASWINHNDMENPLYENFDYVLEIAKEHDVVLSLANGMRAGSIADSTDRAQIQELIILGELIDRSREAGVQCMIEGPGHIPINEIPTNVMIQKKMCSNAPFYMLGPIVCDVAPGYDHIVSAIGAASSAKAGADFICYVTPAEHLALPNPDDVREGVIATKIGAYAGDLATGQIDGSQDLAMAEARKRLDWEAQYECAMFPEAARAKRDQRPPEEEDTCTMCGNYCAVKIVNEWLDQSDSDLIK